MNNKTVPALWHGNKRTKSNMKNNHAQQGQAAVEYAITIVLVSMVVIAIMLLAGFGISRIYGLVAGALGAHYDTHGKHTIEITSAECISSTRVNQTGLWVIGNTDEAIADLTGSTELGSVAKSGTVG